MRVLLSDGSGLTARQTAARLSEAGHVVGVLSPDPLCICRFTRHVKRVHPCPAYGADPMAWLECALDTYRSGGYDVLVATQEQVAVLAAAPTRLQSAGVVTAVPSFAALMAVQDKVSAFFTLTRLGIPQPAGAVDPDNWDLFPAYVKQPIGTASGGVRRITSAEELAEGRAAAAGPILVQQAATGPLAMCQAVFASGSLVAFHANLRTIEGANGGSAAKRSVHLPEARDWIELLGSHLAWHGALSADVIVSDGGPLFIDINPRLVEPNNAWHAGVDLVGALLAVSLGAPTLQNIGRAGVASHQTLLAVLGAAQYGGGRRGVAAQLIAAALRRGELASESIEELTPLHSDLRSALPVALATLATLIRPASYRWFVAGSVGNYALTARTWDDIMAAAEVSAGAS